MFWCSLEQGTRADSGIRHDKTMTVTCWCTELGAWVQE